MDSPAEQHAEPCEPNTNHRPFLLVLLIFALYLAYLTLRPFLETIIFAVVFASLLHPLQVRLVRFYRGRHNLAALTVVFVLTFLIAIPLFLFLSALVNQGIETTSRVNAWINEGNLQRLFERKQLLVVESWFKDHLPFVELDKLDLQSAILDFSKGFGQYALKNAAGILENVASQLSHFFVMIFVVFYLVRDGQGMIKSIKYLSPLREEQEDRIFEGVRLVARSVLLGSFLTAVCQGAAGGIGLAIVGIPALFWGTVMAFASLIPVVGTALVWGPAAIYLTLVGRWQAGLFLVIWSIVLVGSIDNFLRPFLMRGENNLPPFYIFLAIIGGVQYFGLAGILYGPLILTFAMVMLYIYSVEYRDLLDNAKHPPPFPSAGGVADPK